MAHHASQSSFDIAVHCAYECEHCADSCIGDEMMAECARICRDCADICWTASAFMSRGSRFIAQLVNTCIPICEACAAECEKHDSEHCRKCAVACRSAADGYRKIATVGGVA